VLYNNGGACGGDAALTWDDAGEAVVVGSLAGDYAKIEATAISLTGTADSAAITRVGSTFGLGVTGTTDATLVLNTIPLSGTGKVLVNGVTTATLQLGQNSSDGQLIVYSEQGVTDYTTTFNPGTQTMNVVYTLPVDDGLAGEVLSSDGAGALDWVAGVSGPSGPAGGTGATGPSGPSGPILAVFTGNSDGATVAAGVTVYGPANGSYVWVAAYAGSGTASIVPVSGTVKNLYCVTNASNGLGKTNTYTVTLQSVNQTLTCNMVAATTCSDLTHSFAVTAGQEVGFQLVTAAGSTPVKHSCGVQITP